MTTYDTILMTPQSEHTQKFSEKERTEVRQESCLLYTSDAADE